MKNKILIASVSTITIAFAGNVYAVGQNRNAGTGTNNQVQQQSQTSSQVESSQIQTQNNEQIQSENTNQVGVVTQTQIQTQQKLQDGTGTGDQVQDQNQEKNQSEITQIKINEQEGMNGQNSAVAEQKRSQVANEVQQILQDPERNGGIGQQVKTIAQTQTKNQEKLEASLQKVQSRSGFAKFFIGPNYGEINNAEKLLEQNQEQIKELKQIKTQLSNQVDAQTLTQQIQTLEQANLQIENSLQKEQKGFSLFGWMFRLFSK